MGYKQTKRQNKADKAPVTDGRSKDSRRFKAIVQEIVRLVDDLNSPEIVEQLARTFAALVIRQEKHIAKLLDGQPMNSAAYVRLVNCSNRCLKNLGLIPAGNGTDPDGGQDSLESYIASRPKGNGTTRKVDRRRERLGR